MKLAEAGITILMQFKSNPLQKYKRVVAGALRYLLAIFPAV